MVRVATSPLLEPGDPAISPRSEIRF